MANESEVRPFRIDVPEEELVDLRRRVAATRWPDPEPVPDQSQGVQLARIQPLVRYWGTDYDWRKAEERLNALPQFVTEIDGLEIHFVHVRSPHPDALPLLMTHGWPGSIFELLKVIDPLTDPTSHSHGGRAEDAFDLVLPSLPGYDLLAPGGAVDVPAPGGGYRRLFPELDPLDCEDDALHALGRAGGACDAAAAVALGPARPTPMPTGRPGGRCSGSSWPTTSPPTGRR